MMVGMTMQMVVVMDSAQAQILLTNFLNAFLYATGLLPVNLVEACSKSIIELRDRKTEEESGSNMMVVSNKAQRELLVQRRCDSQYRLTADIL